MPGLTSLIRTQYTTHDNTTCPFEFNFDVNLAKLGATKNKNGELQLTIDESTNTTTKMLDLRFNQTSDKYFMERVLIHYSENTFIQNGSIEVIRLGDLPCLTAPWLVEFCWPTGVYLQLCLADGPVPPFFLVLLNQVLTFFSPLPLVLPILANTVSSIIIFTLVWSDEWKYRWVVYVSLI